MSLLQEWRSKLKNLKESPFPEYEEPPVQNTLGGINQPSDPIPVIDVKDGINACNIDCEALKDLLSWAGADQSQTDTIVEKIKILSKEFGSIKTEHLNDILAPATQSTEKLQTVVPVSPNGIESSRLRCYNENLEKVMNDEDIEVVKKNNEK